MRRHENQNYCKLMDNGFALFAIVLLALSAVFFVLVVVGAVIGNAALLIAAAVPSLMLCAYSIASVVTAERLMKIREKR